MRSLTDLSPAAYIGAVEQSVTSFTGERGVCPVLSNVVGGEDCFGRAAPTDTRWRIMFGSGCRVGHEYEQAWNTMRQEAEQGAAYLEEELEGQLAARAVGAGIGSTTGATRKAVVEQREMMRGKVLSKCLKEYLNRRARPAWSWPQRDKLSSQWLLALPAPGSDMSSAVFAEAFASHLCLPSPVCEGRLGEKLCRATVDRFGDNVQAAALPGDGWRTRHDSIKLLLSSLCRWAGLPVRCEVFGLFAHLIPQVGLNRIERGRKRQGLVPDFQLGLSDERGEEKLVLAELKVISCCPTRYSPTHQVRAVDRRARTLNSEYLDKAKLVDRQYGEVQEGTVGPVQRKLESFGEIKGLVFGAFGEGSEDVHTLVQSLATSRARTVALQRGRECSEGELAVIVGEVRRRLSVAAVKAQADCLLNRMSSIGQGAVAAGKRRQWARWEEEMWRQAQMAHRVSQLNSKAVRRQGFFKLD